ncbi:MAG: S-layer homology domain-containing protein [Oscillospiraceae bacterium]|nr:S-layer homology domain-containing protein [Oscillospiraceae bacterium]
MKKFLSLVLALVMTMSLVTISAGAKDFTDDDKITYEEAVNVISTIGVVDGYTDGSFKPTDTLTRGAAAKIICNLILGPTTASELHADTAPYKDVPTSNTFAGYIAYCAKEGIISGYADGTFRPAGSLTGYAFMKMLLGALGYDQANEGYTGPNWSISVAKRALDIGLNKSLEGEFNGVKAVNREEACLYAFNTLKADLVEYETVISTTINGQTVNVGNSIAKAQKWNNSATRINNIKNDDYIQFAEQYFNKLVLNDGTDAFGRPTREWEFKGEDIGEYVNTDLLKATYTEKVTGKDLYALLGKSTIEDYDFDIYVDGETEKSVLGDAYFTDGNLVKTNTEKIGATGNGVTTEVYVDVDAKEVTIAVINTYLAIADDDYNEKKEEASFTVYKISDDGHAGQYVKTSKSSETFKVSNDDINVEDIADEDKVLVTVADGEIQTIEPAETLDEVTITKFVDGKSITTDGTEYKYADTAMYDEDVLDEYVDSNMKDTSYNVFLDKNGYMVGIEIVEEASKYLFLTGMDTSNSNLINKTADANVILLDGTMDTVKVNTSKSETDNGLSLNTIAGPIMNTWCTYTVDKSGVYTLTQVADDTASFVDAAGKTDKVGQGKQTDEANAAVDKNLVTIDKKHVTLNGISTTGFERVYGNDSSVYISAETDLIAAKIAHNGTVNHVVISGVSSVSTGVQTTSLEAYNAAAVQNSDSDYATVPLYNISNGVYTLFKDNGYIIATIVVGEDAGASTNYAYVISDTGKAGMNMEAYDSTEDEYTWTRDVVVNGEIVELTEVGDGTPEIQDMTRGGWYEVKYLADGTVRSVDPVTFVDNAPEKFVSKIERVEKSVERFDTVILHEDLTVANNNSTYVISVKGNTLQVDTTTAVLSRGFAVAPTAKIALVQDVEVIKDGVVTKIKTMDETYEYDNGVKGLEKAIKDLNDNENFNGYLSAVFEDGVATSVVIWDQSRSQVDTGNQGGVNGYKVIAGSAAYMYTDAEIYTGDEAWNAAKAINVLADKIRNDGYAVANVRAGTVSGSLTYEDRSGTEITVVVDQTNRVFKIKSATLSDAENVTCSETYVQNGDVVTFTITNKSGNAIVGTYTSGTCNIGTVTDVTGRDGIKALVLTVAVSGVTADADVALTIGY